MGRSTSSTPSDEEVWERGPLPHPLVREPMRATRLLLSLPTERTRPPFRDRPPPAPAVHEKTFDPC